MTQKVLVSYCHRDSDFVRKLDADLIDAGTTAWIDYRSIPPGRPWRQAIYDGIAESDTVIMCLSPHYLQSEICLQEAYIARTYDKRILPVMVENCYEDLSRYDETKGIEHLFIVEFTGKKTPYTLGTYADSFQRLIDALHHQPGQERQTEYYVSFGSVDADFATQLGRDLDSAGINAWVATLDLMCGDPWWGKLAKAMMNARSLIVVLSPQAARSDWVRREVLLARTRDIPLIPVVPARVAADESLLSELYRVINDSYEMRLLGEIHFIFERPNYAAMLETLKAVLTDQRAEVWRSLPVVNL